MWVSNWLWSWSWGDSRSAIGSDVSLSGKTVLSSGVPDNSLFATCVEDSIGAFHCAVGKSGFFSETLSKGAFASVISEFVVTGQILSDIDVMNRGWWMVVALIAGSCDLVLDIVVSILGESHSKNSADGYLKKLTKADFKDST